MTGAGIWGWNCVVGAVVVKVVLAAVVVVELGGGEAKMLVLKSLAENAGKALAGGLVNALTGAFGCVGGLENFERSNLNSELGVETAAGFTGDSPSAGTGEAAAVCFGAAGAGIGFLAKAAKPPAPIDPKSASSEEPTKDTSPCTPTDSSAASIFKHDSMGSALTHSARELPLPFVVFP